MTKDEIIKALRDMAKYPTVTLPRDCEALRAAADLLAQPEQEPIAWKLLGSAHFRKTLPKNTDVTKWSPLYSAPQRSWVGLSEKKQWEIARNISCFDWGELMSETEQALKELNT